MNTNAAPIIQTLAQHAGYDLSVHDIEALFAGAAVVVRWLHVDVPVWIRTWHDCQGFRGAWRFLTTGNVNKPTETKGS